jgi:hypothetical protein
LALPLPLPLPFMTGSLEVFCHLVALAAVWDLLLCAKHLFRRRQIRHSEALRALLGRVLDEVEG